MTTYHANPSSNLNSMISILLPGDILQLADGTYTQRMDIRRSGTLANPITIRGSANAIFDGTGIAVPEYASWVYILANYVTLDGFTIKNVGSKGEGVGIGDDALPKIRGCKILNMRIDNIYSHGIIFENHDDGLIENCHTSNLSMVWHPITGRGAVGATDWAVCVGFCRGSNNNVCRNCIIHDTWGEPVGAFFGAQNNTFEKNIIYSHYAPIYSDASPGTRFLSNFFYNANMLVNGVSQQKQDRAIVFVNEDSQQSLSYGLSSDNCIAENNIIVGYNIPIGIDRFPNNPYMPTGSIIRNNTIVSGRVGPFSYGASGIAENNILYNAYFDGFVGTIRNNIIYPSAGTLGSPVSTANPQLFNPAANYTTPGAGSDLNYKITSNSPAINTANNNAPPFDYFGNART